MQVSVVVRSCHRLSARSFATAYVQVCSSGLCCPWLPALMLPLLPLSCIDYRFCSLLEGRLAG